MKIKQLVFLALVSTLMACEKETFVLDEVTGQEQQQSTTLVNVTMEYSTDETEWNSLPEKTSQNGSLVTGSLYGFSAEGSLYGSSVTGSPNSSSAKASQTLTRASLSSSGVTRIALQVFDKNGEKVGSVYEQTVGDENFGTFSSLRLPPGNYTFVAVAHKAASLASPCATIDSPTSITIGEKPLYAVYTCSQAVTVSSGNYTAQEVVMSMKLCVSRLTVVLKDALPEGTANIKLMLNTAGSDEQGVTFNPVTGVATIDHQYTKEWTIGTNNIGLTDCNFSITALMDTWPKTVDATMTAFDADGNATFTRSFYGLVLKRGTILTLNTNLFTGSTDVSMEFEDWNNETIDDL